VESGTERIIHIDLIQTTQSPMASIAKFHSTCVMNSFDGNVLVVGFSHYTMRHVSRHVRVLNPNDPLSSWEYSTTLAWPTTSV
jgi:hypothetical protein